MSESAVVEEAIAIKREPGERGPEVSILTELKARNLYLHERLSYLEISEKTGIPVRSLQALASRKGWTAVRREQKRRLIEKQDARNAAMQNAVVEAIASASEEHAIRGLQRAGEALERNDKDAAKDFQAYTAGVKNLAGVAKLMRDGTGSAVESGGSISMNFFFAPQSTQSSNPVPSPLDNAKNVTPTQ